MKNEQPKFEILAKKEVAFVSFTGNYIGNAQVLKIFLESFMSGQHPKE